MPHDQPHEDTAPVTGVFFRDGDGTLMQVDQVQGSLVSAHAVVQRTFTVDWVLDHLEKA
jgi:hypothetical protein